MSNDLFNQMRNAAAQETDGQRQLSFQERIVKQLLRRANVQLPTLRSVKAEAVQKYGREDLDFEWLYGEFPAFPMRMLAQKMKYTQTSLADIYGKGRFKKLCWWKEYEQQVALYGVNLETDRAALCFNLPYAQDAFLMVLHNQPSQGQLFRDAELRDDEPWPRTTFPMRSGIVAVLESFDSFLQTVGTEWADR